MNQHQNIRSLTSCAILICLNFLLTNCKNCKDKYVIIEKGKPMLIKETKPDTIMTKFNFGSSFIGKKLTVTVNNHATKININGMDAHCYIPVIYNKHDLKTDIVILVNSEEFVVPISRTYNWVNISSISENRIDLDLRWAY